MRARARWSVVAFVAVVRLASSLRPAPRRLRATPGALRAADAETFTPGLGLTAPAPLAGAPAAADAGARGAADGGARATKKSAAVFGFFAASDRELGFIKRQYERHGFDDSFVSSMRT